MSVTTVGHHVVHYEAIGRGRPLLFLHGWLGSWRYWWPVMQGLSGSYRTFALDLLGFGDSGKDPNEYSLSGYARLLHTFVHQLGVRGPVTVIGHGLGAAVALRYGREHPDAVHQMALVSLPMRGDHIHGRLATTAPGVFWSRYVGRRKGHAAVERELHKTDQRAVTRVTRELQGLDMSDDVDRCRFPLLAIYGERDPIVSVPPDLDALLQWPLINHQFVAVDAWSHFPMLEQAAQFTRLLLDFMGSDHQLLAVKEYWRRRTR